MRKRQCRMCREEFPVRREWKIFCSVKCRRRWHKDNTEHCFFCGQWAQDRHRHHIEPCSWQGYRTYKDVEWVGTCPKCNLAIGAQRFAGALETAEFLLCHYRSKVKPRPAWDEEDFEDMGHSLRRRINKMLAEERQYTDRVAFLEAFRIHLQADIV